MKKVKEIPYGVANFVEVVEQNMYYVDKTMYLPLLEKAAPQFVLYPPPSFRQEHLSEYAPNLL